MEEPALETCGGSIRSYSIAAADRSGADRGAIPAAGAAVEAAVAVEVIGAVLAAEAAVAAARAIVGKQAMVDGIDPGVRVYGLSLR